MATRRPKGSRHLFAAAVVGILAATAATTTVGASSGTPTVAFAPGALPGTALVRVAHLSPDTAGVDVYVDGVRTLGNVNFETVSNYLSVPAGRHHLELRPAGAAPSTKAVLATTRTLASQGAYTVAGLGLRAKLRGQVFADDLSSPASGVAKVRALHAAVGVSGVDIDLVGGPTLGADVAFASATPYAPVQPGRYQLRVRDQRSGRTLLTVPGLNFGAGVVYSVAVIGGAAGTPVEALPLVDARGVQALPAGAVQTGAGGTAPVGVDSDSTGGWIAAGGLTVVIGGLAMLAVRRRRSTP